MGTGNEGLIFALGHLNGKRYSRERRRKQEEPSGCLVAVAKFFIWLSFFGRLVLLAVVATAVLG